MNRPGYPNDPYAPETVVTTGTTTKIPSLDEYDTWSIYTEEGK